ncbi:MAG: hypothetical protein JWQ89_37 [Devosia sp.]|uniref:SgcJ/EcaC family oxidoreductase n=1 Tax=Devosia sp. TaxID=1871048 RepID=UPI00261AB5C8|nr:SgcJ/EcaC family oxidoreductase [Devosia sp.]MDB5538310.1 hypothetical protein [Devosia sp.]
MDTVQDAIIAEVEAFSAAWNLADPQRAATFFTEDGVRVGAFGDQQRGRAELAAAYRKLFEGPMAGAALHQERGTVRLLTPELAIWQGGIEVTGPAGPPLKGHVVQVMKKVGNRWLVLESHPKFFPPRPAPHG